VCGAAGNFRRTQWTDHRRQGEASRFLATGPCKYPPEFRERGRRCTERSCGSWSLRWFTTNSCLSFMEHRGWNHRRMWCGRSSLNRRQMNRFRSGVAICLHRARGLLASIRDGIRCGDCRHPALDGTL